MKLRSQSGSSSWITIIQK